MRIFVIEAHSGRERMDGPIATFTVHADTVDQAVQVIRHSHSGQHFERFSVVEETGEIEADVPGIIHERLSLEPKPA